MNRSQKTVLKFSLGLALLIGLFPPWMFFVDESSIHLSQHAGYHFLLGSVEVPAFDTNHNTQMFSDFREEIQVRLDSDRLAVEWFTLLLVTGLLLLLLKGKNETKSTAPS
jgi:hypothetical protein